VKSATETITSQVSRRDHVLHGERFVCFVEHEQGYDVHARMMDNEIDGREKCDACVDSHDIHM
jgi:hypothetical protein